jgi:hypothetical protein
MENQGLKRRNLDFDTFILIALLEGILSLALFFLIPPDAKNAFFLGYSLRRWVLILITVGLIVILFIVYKEARSHRKWILKFQKACETLSKNRTLLLLVTAGASVCLFLSLLLIYCSFYPLSLKQSPYLLRLFPWFFWIALFSVQCLFWLGYKGYLHEYWHAVIGFPNLVLFRINLNPKQEKLLYWILTGTVTLFWVGYSAFVLMVGQPNADEGWYLYASKLVYQGKLPYQDFAFTQMPLLPYIYGIPQLIFSSSIFLGRLTSFCLALVTLGLTLIIVFRYTGKTGAFWIALLFATYLPGIFSGVVVKTYVLTACLITITFFLLTSKSRPTVRFPSAALSAIAAGMTRLSALVFAVPIVAYSLIFTKPVKAKLFILLVCVLSAAGFSILLFPNQQAVYWNVLGYHLNAAGPTAGFSSLWSRLWAQLPNLIKLYRNYWPLLIPILWFGLYRVKRFSQLLRTSEYFRILLVMAISITAFQVSHLISGRYYSEYFVPGILTMLPILVILVLKTSCQFTSGSIARIVATLALLSVAALNFRGWLDYSLSYYQACEGCSPMMDIHEVGKFIRENTNPGDKVYALENLFVAIDADRPVLPNLSMAQFSITELDDDEALSLHLVNQNILRQYITQTLAKVLVLSPRDLSLIQADPQTTAVLADKYRMVLQRSHFGQKADELRVYFLK